MEGGCRNAIMRGIMLLLWAPSRSHFGCRLWVRCTACVFISEVERGKSLTAAAAAFSHVRCVKAKGKGVMKTFLLRPLGDK